MISQQSIQQILSRIDIVEIVGGFVKLRKRGANYLGLCPFHNEKTPSFTVSPSKEIYKCFGCGRSGNSIGFLMEHEKYSYVEALRWLAAKYNVELEETEQSPEQKLKQQVSESLYIINQFAAKYFSQTLWENDEGQDIGLSYLHERGFQDAILEKFQIGYSLRQRDAFAQAALSAQYNPELLLKTGLVVQRDGQYLDNYRGRIIFPVHSQTGKVIGFGARVIGSADKAPKYINTPENELYVKSRILYGSYFARQAIDKFDECLLVEGYTDVISLHQAGIENVVASGGTSLTTDQLRLIKKYSKNLTILYDGDSAGVKAALRGLDMAVEEGLNVKLVLIPDKEDPDSYVNKLGAARFREFIDDNKRDFILFLLDVSLREAGSDSTRKAAVVNQIAETISKINKAEDFTRQQDYIKRSAEILQIEEAGLNALVNKHIRDKIGKQETRAAAALEETAEPGIEAPDDETLSLLLRDEKQERGLMRCLLEFGLQPWNEEQTVADLILEEFDEMGLLEENNLVALLETYRSQYLAGKQPGIRQFLYHEDPAISTLAVNLMDVQYEISPNWSEHYDGKIFTREELYREDVASTLNYLKLRKVKRMIEENQKDLEKPHPTEQTLILLQTHQHLKEMEVVLTRQLGTVILK